MQRQQISFAENELSVTFIGHSTFLIRADGVTIITDPVFSEMASPVECCGPHRSRPPAIALNNLPPIDIILVSHNHYDHLDKNSIEAIFRLNSDTPPALLAPLGNARLFKQWGIEDSTDLDWGQHTVIRGLKLELHEARHRSGRGLLDQMETLWGSFVIHTGFGPIYFSGDTGYGVHFSNTSKQTGPITLSLLPIGAYQPRWFMEQIHLNPADAVRAHRDLQSRLSIGMHYGTFQLTTEGINQPLQDLETAKKSSGIADDEFITLGFGETLRIK